mmetsp:Transcript_47942/g.133514  ORF Transcript_47942/g.133514 Transcript_47942/m.133514 type:complete len:186 (+) Transcript_47942:50-607(+)
MSGLWHARCSPAAPPRLGASSSEAPKGGRGGRGGAGEEAPRHRPQSAEDKRRGCMEAAPGAKTTARAGQRQRQRARAHPGAGCGEAFASGRNPCPRRRPAAGAPLRRRQLRRGRCAAVDAAPLEAARAAHSPISWQRSTNSGGIVHIMMAPSEPQETMNVWSGEIAQHVIPPLWPTPMALQTPSS